MAKFRFMGFIALAMCAFAAPAVTRAAPADHTTGAAFHADIVFDGNTAGFPLWTDVMARATQEQQYTAVCIRGGERSCAPQVWRELITRLDGLPLMAKLETVNRFINRYPYVPTWQNWHRSSYWEAPFEFLARGGQCQDYAIAKYLALHAVGVSDAQIRVLILRDTDLGIDHAVLLADVDGVAYILDNLNATIIPADRDTQYRPYYAINQSGYWTYVGGRSMLAASDAAAR